jgi:hypothetical protein
MILQDERFFGCVSFIFGHTIGRRGSFDLGVILNENAVVQHGHGAWFEESALFIEARGVEDDVVSLPLGRFPGGIDQRRMLFIDGAGLAVGISFILVGIEHLQFVAALQVDAAVAAPLACAFDFQGWGPLDVDLAIPEGLGGGNAAGAIDRRDAVLDLPSGGAAGVIFLARQIPAVKEDNGVGRGRARGDDGRFRGLNPVRRQEAKKYCQGDQKAGVHGLRNNIIGPGRNPKALTR